MRSITDAQAFTILESWFSQDMDKQRFFRAFCYAYVKKNIPYNAFKKTDYDYIYSLKRSADATPAALAYIKFQQSHLPVAPNLGQEQDVNLDQDQDVNLGQDQDQDVEQESDQDVEQEQESDVEQDQESQYQSQDEIYQQLETIIQSQNTIIQVLFLILFIVGLPIVTDNIDLVYAMLYPNRNCRPLLPY
jgi:hypothetical protein